MVSAGASVGVSVASAGASVGASVPSAGASVGAYQLTATPHQPDATLTTL